MVRIVYSNYFERSARHIPGIQLVKLSRLLLLLQENPFDPRLHTKQLTSELSGLFSFRITRDWRVIFRFESPEEIVLIDIGHRKDIYK